MKKSTALTAFGLISAIPQSVSAVDITTAEKVVETSTEFSIGLTTWLLFFGIALLLFLLSLSGLLQANEAPEFCGLTSFVFFCLCGVALPYVGSTQYISESVVVGSEIVQVLTPVVISETNWLMVAAAIFMILLSLLNAWRIVMLRLEQATPDARISDRRQARRAELLERWK